MALSVHTVIPAHRHAGATRPIGFMRRLATGTHRLFRAWDRWLHLPDVDADPASVQRILVELGRLDVRDATGERNPATAHALACFQAEAGLAADGVAGPATVHALARAWHGPDRRRVEW